MCISTASLFIYQDIVCWPYIRYIRLPMLRNLRRVPDISRLLKQTRNFSNTSINRSSRDMETVQTGERLARLRSLMKQNKVDIYSTLSHA